jgi:hypothetical protein
VTKTLPWRVCQISSLSRVTGSDQVVVASVMRAMCAIPELVAVVCASDLVSAGGAVRRVRQHRLPGKRLRQATARFGLGLSSRRLSVIR